MISPVRLLRTVAFRGRTFTSIGKSDLPRALAPQCDHRLDIIFSSCFCDTTATTVDYKYYVSPGMVRIRIRISGNNGAEPGKNSSPYRLGL